MAVYEGNGTKNVTLKDENGEVIEQFESSGCIYHDFGCCQGCYVCSLEDK